MRLSALVSAISAVETVAGKNLLHQGHKADVTSGYHSFLPQGFSRKPFYDLPKRENEQMGGLREG